MGFSNVHYLYRFSVSLKGVTCDDIDVAPELLTLKLSYHIVTKDGILTDSNPSIRDKAKVLNEDA